jgi:hypothetical protein
MYSLGELFNWTLNSLQLWDAAFVIIVINANYIRPYSE